LYIFDRKLCEISSFNVHRPAGLANLYVPVGDGSPSSSPLPPLGPPLLSSQKHFLVWDLHQRNRARRAP